ncbi:MAG: ABC transporter ATP-binding protein [Candidatus Asgardarchaeia archaeon]
MGKNMRMTQIVESTITDMSPRIQLDNVKKVYKSGSLETIALRGVTLSVYPNDFLMVVGPSGSGKSTMLHLMGALDKPTEGKVFIEGYDIGSLKKNDLANIRLTKVGFVFQFFNLIPTLTAIENVELPMALANVPKKLRRKRAIELLKAVGLGHRTTHLPSELSGGEQQRVAIARALANNPAILLLDEPTGNVDSKTAASIMQVLTNLNRDGRTIVMITHNHELIKYANRVAQIRDGIIISDERKEQEV